MAYSAYNDFTSLNCLNALQLGNVGDTSKKIKITSNAYSPSRTFRLPYWSHNTNPQNLISDAGPLSSSCGENSWVLATTAMLPTCGLSTVNHIITRLNPNNTYYYVPGFHLLTRDQNQDDYQVEIIPFEVLVDSGTTSKTFTTYFSASNTNVKSIVCNTIRAPNSTTFNNMSSSNFYGNVRVASWSKSGQTVTVTLNFPSYSSTYFIHGWIFGGY